MKNYFRSIDLLRFAPRVAFLVAIGFLIIGNAQAGSNPFRSVTYSAAITNSYTDWTGSLALPRFNLPGILDHATLLVHLNYDQTLSATNLDSTPRDITLGGTIEFKTPFGVNPVQTNQVPTSTVATDVTLSRHFLGFIELRYDIPVNQLSLYRGNTGPLVYNFEADATSSYDGPGDYSFSASTQAGVFMSITYNYHSSGHGSEDDCGGHREFSSQGREHKTYEHSGNERHSHRSGDEDRRPH